MILTVTSIIRNGEIVFPSIGYAVKAGSVINITDEQFYANDIQVGIRKGYLKVVDEQGHAKSSFAKRIKVTNLTGKPLAFDTISLLKGETRLVSERETLTVNFARAVKAGFIEVEDPNAPAVEVEDNGVEEVEKVRSKHKSGGKKTRILKKDKKAEKASKTLQSSAPKQETAAEKIARLKKEAAKVDMDHDADFVDKTEDEAEEAAQAEVEMNEAIEEEEQKEVRANMQSWNPHTKKMMNREESSSKVAKIVSSRVSKKPTRTITDEGIMTGDIDFTDDGVDTAKKVSGKSGAKLKKKAGISPVGTVRPDPSKFPDGDVGYDNDSEISFVDREQQVERLRARPDIISRKQRQNEEIE